MKSGFRVKLSPFLLLVFLILSLFSCVKKVKIKELEEYKSKPVMAGFISNSDSTQIFIGRSVGVYDTEGSTDPVEGALVRVMQGNDTLSELEWHSDFYVSSFRGNPGENYRVEAVLPDGARVSADVDMPGAAGLFPVQYDLVPFRGNDEYGNIDTVLVKVKFHLNDLPGQKDFYQIIAQYSLDGTYSGWMMKLQAMPFSYHKIKPGPADQNGFYYRGTYFFSDDGFDGQAMDFDVFYTQLYLQGDGHVYFIIRHVNGDLYRFYRSLLYATGYDGGMIGGNSLAENVYSNVRNGLGTVGAYYQHLDSLYFILPQ